MRGTHKTRRAKGGHVGMQRGWNPKRLGVVKSSNGDFETDMWLYLEGSRLDIVVSIARSGICQGQTVHMVRLPARRP